MTITIEARRIVVEIDLTDLRGLDKLAELVLPELGRIVAASMPDAVPDPEPGDGPTERAA